MNKKGASMGSLDDSGEMPAVEPEPPELQRIRKAIVTIGWGVIAISLTCFVEMVRKGDAESLVMASVTLLGGSSGLAAALLMRRA
jgi:hypothetical protein